MDGICGNHLRETITGWDINNTYMVFHVRKWPAKWSCEHCCLLICQSGIWKAQRPTNVNAVSTGTVYTCGHQAGVTNTHPLAQGITATCPMGSTLVGGVYQLMGSTPLKSSPSDRKS